jgi:hypothetical protein
MASQNFFVFVRPTMAGAEATYVAQCVEFDMCVQGKTLQEIQDRLNKMILGHILISKKLGREPFAWLPPGKVKQAQRVATVKAHRRTSLTPAPECMPRELKEDYSFVPRGELTLAVV